MRESVGKGSKTKGKAEKAAAIPAPALVVVVQEAPAAPPPEGLTSAQRENGKGRSHEGEDEE
jgi:hypothetical protein